MGPTKKRSDEIGTPKKNPTEYVGSPKQKLLCPPNPYWMEHDELTIAEVLGENNYKSAYKKQDSTHELFMEFVVIILVSLFVNIKLHRS